MRTFKENGIFIFLGPTLTLDEARKIMPQAYYLPPVRCGDIIHVLRLKPSVIAIIDGFFEHTASVWHKEILLALDNGVIVCGASSMGALRAAELNNFQMVGIGKIFECYKNGTIIDDDEVAILHKDEKNIYEPVTDAMVNIRFTLEKAIDKNIINKQESQLIATSAKQLFYQQRTLTKACKKALQNGLMPNTAKQFLTWCNQGGYVDQKRLDAITLLKRLATEKLPKPDNKFTLSCTSVLCTLQRSISCQPFPTYQKWLPIQEKVALKAKTLDDIYPLLQRLARIMAIVHAIAVLQDNNITKKDPPFGTLTYDKSWQLENDCSGKAYANFIKRMQYLAKITSFTNNKFLTPDIETQVLTFLKISGDYIKHKSLLDLEKNNDTQYRILVYTAYLWRVIAQYAAKIGLDPGEHELAKHVTSFRTDKELFTKKATLKWLQDNHLDESAFIALMKQILLFDYIVKCNNVYAFDAFRDAENNWWLLDSLYLTGIYPELKRISFSEIN